MSCVEAGRWDGSREREHFRPAPQAAYPDLRRIAQRRIRELVANGEAPRPDQREIWREVARRQQQLRTHSATGAMNDIYRSRRDRLAELRGSIRRHRWQCGAAVAIGSEISVLDYVGRADVWEHLHEPLLDGYALDALRCDRKDFQRPSVERVQGMIDAVAGAPGWSADADRGLGTTIRFDADGVAGSALVVDRELVQLTAYPEQREGEDPIRQRPRPHRRAIRRPSRRRDSRRRR